MTQTVFDGLEAQLAVERRKVDVASVSFSTRELVRMYEADELSIAPAYQRKYRWRKKVASAFIESIFLGLPIPPIFVATNSDFRWEVVDGLQRISTLILFMSSDAEARERVRSETPLALGELEKLTQLNGYGYADLPDTIQRHFSRQPLQIISLTDKSDKSVRFDLFERLNTGSISLTPQEVRTAVYGGDFLDFIERISANSDLGSLLKLQDSNKHDGTSTEQVLKFFAYKNDSDKFKGAVTTFLNNFAEQPGDKFDYVLEQATFEATVSFLAKAVGGPFLRSGTSVTPLVQFEATLLGIARIIERGESPRVPEVDWLNDKELIDSSTGGTNTRSMLSRRVDRAEKLFSGQA
ncbi:DUF262 domain-containing protein [Leucobacter viscericola]|uniref:DUF262 domain-containing protein n=1 Tax=Leucobacter viscericola TaxID=2714935 RepID=A0A6G7XED6_9MICO|nr:DUF262 domain-containing protein [Leucobacter viscericola]QIK62925.1 DUF262 domain-containing protein [Leucobacter viscericola]